MLQKELPWEGSDEEIQQFVQWECWGLICGCNKQNTRVVCVNGDWSLIEFC